MSHNTCCVPGQWCGECGLLACTPGDYLCSCCRKDLGIEKVKWVMEGASPINGAYAVVYLLSTDNQWSYVIDEKGRTYQVASTAIHPLT